MVGVKKLIEQILKFGVVGIIAFLIDWGILNLLVGVFHMHNVIAATISFTIALIFNYFASMKYVFRHRPDMARWMEMAIFVFSAVVGLLINGLIIWLSTYGMNKDAFITQHAEYLLRTNIGKLIATVIVAVWNFIIRKWLLDDTHTNAMNRLRGHVLSEEELEAFQAVVGQRCESERSAARTAAGLRRGGRVAIKSVAGRRARPRGDVL